MLASASENYSPSARIPRLRVQGFQESQCDIAGLTDEARHCDAAVSSTAAGSPPRYPQEPGLGLARFQIFTVVAKAQGNSRRLSTSTSTSDLPGFVPEPRIQSDIAGSGPENIQPDQARTWTAVERIPSTEFWFLTGESHDAAETGPVCVVRRMTGAEAEGARRSGSPLTAVERDALCMPSIPRSSLGGHFTPAQIRLPQQVGSRDAVLSLHPLWQKSPPPFKKIDPGGRRRSILRYLYQTR